MFGDTSASQGSPHPFLAIPKLVSLSGSPIGICREPLIHLPGNQSGEHPLDGHSLILQALCPLILMDFTVAPKEASFYPGAISRVLKPRLLITSVTPL